MKKIILFDLDGTLTDSKYGIIRCVKYALESVGIHETDNSKLMPFIGPPLIDVFQEVYGFKKDEAAKLVEKYRERFSEKGIYENSLYPGIKELLSELKRNGKILVLATSKPIVFATRIVEHFDIAKYFDLLSGAELDGRNNYKSEVIESAIERLSLENREDVVMVGDRRQDIEGAKACKIQSIGVKYGYAGPDELESAGADIIVQTIDDLKNILLS